MIDQHQIDIHQFAKCKIIDLSISQMEMLGRMHIELMERKNKTMF